MILPIFQEPLGPIICLAFVASGIPLYLVLIKPEEAPRWARKTDFEVRHQRTEKLA